ncbi:MAG: hypothetical protein ISS79_00945 [Phycisphaerae bacterium]|nr:hypothetical protein [Phycisphaerae bacterium]
MGDRKKEMLSAQTISRLLDFQGVDVAKEDGSEKSSVLPKSVQAPTSEHLDFGDPVPAVGAGEVDEEPPDDWEQHDEDISPQLSAPRPRASSTRWKKLAMLIPALSIVLLVVLNKFHDVRLLDSKWLRSGTYRNIVGGLVESGFSLAGPAGQYPVKLKVRGIALSRARPSAVIGTTIVHEGDIVLGATIAKISTKGVEFELNGERWVQKVQ